MLCGLKSTLPRWHAIQWLQSLQQSSGCNCCRQFVAGGKRGARVAEQARAVGRFELASSWEFCKFLWTQTFAHYPLRRIPPSTWWRVRAERQWLPLVSSALLLLPALSASVNRGWVQGCVALPCRAIRIAVQCITVERSREEDFPPVAGAAPICQGSGCSVVQSAPGHNPLPHFAAQEPQVLCRLGCKVLFRPAMPEDFESAPNWIINVLRCSKNEPEVASWYQCPKSYWIQFLRPKQPFPSAWIQKTWAKSIALY